MSLWTTQQHQWLQALGHPVLLLVGDPALSAAPVPPPVAEPEGATGTTAATRPVQAGTRPTRPASTGPKRVNPVADEPAGEAGHIRPRTDVAAKKAALDEARRARRASRPAAPTAPQDDDALQAAILLATGLKGSAAQQAVAALAIDLEKLRADPSAKRALWRQLQDLRGGRNR